MKTKLFAWFTSDLEHQLSVTEKTKEGLVWDLDHTRKANQTYQREMKEQAMQQVIETSQLQVSTSHVLCISIFIICDNLYQEEKISTLTHDKEALELQVKTLQGEL